MPYMPYPSISRCKIHVANPLDLLKSMVSTGHIQLVPSRPHLGTEVDFCIRMHPEEQGRLRGHRLLRTWRHVVTPWSSWSTHLDIKNVKWPKWTGGEAEVFFFTWEWGQVKPKEASHVMLLFSMLGGHLTASTSPFHRFYIWIYMWIYY